jgi:uncharacterized protein (DUF486 family)
VKKALLSVVLLCLSNTFMNTAWYGHLKYKSAPIWIAIVASWGIAFFEYCLQVPANRIGSEALSLTQLKVTQEVLSIATFAVIAIVMFKEKFTFNHVLSFLFIGLGAYFAARK